jgi:hypothetical protein
VLTRLENVLKGDDAAPGAYLVSILCSLSTPLLCNPKLLLSLYAFWKSERNGECLICFVLVPAPILSDAVMEPVIRPAPPQAALNLPASAETPVDPASQAASVQAQAMLLALLSQASNVPMSADGQ